MQVLSTPVANAAFCTFRVNATFTSPGLSAVYGVFGGGSANNASDLIYVVPVISVMTLPLMTTPLQGIKLKVARTGAVAMQAMSGAVIVAGGCGVTTE